MAIVVGCCSQTDSLCCHIETKDLYADMGENLDLFDTSNFETGSVAPKEFVGLRAKMYSLHVPNHIQQSKIRAKGIKKAYVQKHVRHLHFLKTIRTNKTTKSRFRTFQSKKIMYYTPSESSRHVSARLTINVI